MSNHNANMHYEYAVQCCRHEGGEWHQVTQWSPEPNPYQQGFKPKHNERIVRRLVSELEEVPEP